MPRVQLNDALSEHAGSDEALGEQLDRHLLELSGTIGPAPARAVDFDESRELRPVIERLHRLRVFLAAAAAGVAPFDPDVAETRDHVPASDTTSGADASSLNGEEPAPRPAHGEPDSPARIGKYQIVRPLGAGGQGAAVLAFDPDLRRHVVLKLYYAARSPETRRILLGEGRALARVKSPYVADVHAAEEYDGVPCLIVEYIPGRSLAELLADGPLPVERALELTRQIAEGLSSIHACGLLHRDIKPANVIVADDGLPRLVDFGLAAHLASEELQEVSGTPAYMAPEQARGEFERIDARADLFAIGAMLYEMLTGRPPRQAATRTALLEQARHGEIAPLVEVVPDIPPQVDALCMRCLAKEPTQRFRSAAELVEAIEQITRKKGGLVANLKLRFGKWTLTISLSAALLLVSAVVLLNQTRRRSPAPADHSPLTTHHSAEDFNPLGRPLRQDFGVKLDLLGRERDASGGWKLREGEQVALALEVARDAYVGVWHVDHEGNVLQLFPNEFDRDHLVRAGRPRIIPGEKKYAIRATPSQGREYVHVVAATKRWSPAPGVRDGAYAAFTTPEQQKQWQDQLRGLVLVPAPANGRQPAVSEVIIPFHVEAN